MNTKNALICICLTFALITIKIINPFYYWPRSPNIHHQDHLHPSQLCTSSVLCTFASFSVAPFITHNENGIATRIAESQSEIQAGHVSFSSITLCDSPDPPNLPLRCLLSEPHVAEQTRKALLPINVFSLPSPLHSSSISEIVSPCPACTDNSTRTKSLPFTTSHQCHAILISIPANSNLDGHSRLGELLSFANSST